jgi:hypothetical protein
LGQNQPVIPGQVGKKTQTLFGLSTQKGIFRTAQSFFPIIDSPLGIQKRAMRLNE